MISWIQDIWIQAYIKRWMKDNEGVRSYLLLTADMRKEIEHPSGKPFPLEARSQEMQVEEIEIALEVAASQLEILLASLQFQTKAEAAQA